VVQTLILLLTLMMIMTIMTIVVIKFIIFNRCLPVVLLRVKKINK